MRTAANIVADKTLKPDLDTVPDIPLPRRTMSIAYDDMFTQLDEAWPLASFPFLAVLPTSEVIMMVGSLNALYTISPTTFNLVFSRNLPMRPDGIPWTYPQTGVAVLLPLDPANNYAVKVSGSSWKTVCRSIRLLVF